MGLYIVLPRPLSYQGLPLRALPPLLNFHRRALYHRYYGSVVTRRSPTKTAKPYRLPWMERLTKH